MGTTAKAHADAGTISQGAKSRRYCEASIARLAFTYSIEIHRPSILYPVTRAYISVPGKPAS